MVFLPASNLARLPAGGIEAVVKETVGKRKKPETVKTKQNKKKNYRKGGGDKGNGTKWLKPVQSDAIIRDEASVAEPRALTPVFQ